jgi:hypothetical protein
MKPAQVKSALLILLLLLPLLFGCSPAVQVTQEYHSANHLQAAVEKMEDADGSTNVLRAIAFGSIAVKKLKAIEQQLSKGVVVHEWNRMKFASYTTGDKQSVVSVVFYPGTTNFHVANIHERTAGTKQTFLFSFDFYPDGKPRLVDGKNMEEGMMFSASGRISRYWVGELNPTCEIHWDEEGRITIDWTRAK